jgi:hypothetical protein
MRASQEMIRRYSFNLDAINSERIKKKHYYTCLSTYVILNYDKNFMSFDDTITGLYRSVIFSFPSKKIVCFSPPKSIPYSIFLANNPTINDDIYINEAIEGTSINLFYDKNISKWNISTKSSIGGKYWFYGKKNKDNQKQYTFLEMFLDALREPINKDLNDVAILEYLPKDYCYNFVMQHSSNSIIFTVNKSTLYLIGVYLIDNNDVEFIPQIEYQEWNIFRHDNGVIQFPKSYTVSNYSDIDPYLMIKGYMITNMQTGDRTKLINKRYEDIKSLIRIKPSVQYQFLCMNNLGKEKINEYLALFPRFKKEFYFLRNLYNEFITGVFKSYLSRYIYKEDIPVLAKYESHIYKIYHNVYLPRLDKHTITKIRYKNIVDYFNKMEPREMFYILNWDSRNL